MNDFVISARSRYRLEAKSLSEFRSYVVDVIHDYYNKTVSATVLDALVKGKPVIHEWIIRTLRDPGQEVLTLEQHDANGNTLYKKVLKGVKLVGHRCNHNYECEGDDLQDHELLFMYDELVTVDNVN
jgi:hypothetical protein